MTREQKLEKYKQGRYLFKCPPVCTHLWDENDWLNYVDACNAWQFTVVYSDNPYRWQVDDDITATIESTIFNTTVAAKDEKEAIEKAKAKYAEIHNKKELRGNCYLEYRGYKIYKLDNGSYASNASHRRYNSPASATLDIDEICHERAVMKSISQQMKGY